MMIIILIGPPGSGKTTQAKVLSKRLKVPAILMGGILRQAKKAGTMLGQEASKYTEEGKLIPSQMIRALTKFRLEDNDCKSGFVLDGAPRKVEEAVFLDDYLNRKNMKVDKVFILEINKSEIINRILVRSKLPSKNGGGRNDDNIEDIKVRIQEFTDYASDLKSYYQNKEILCVIDGRKSIEEVTNRIFSELQL